MAPRQDQILDPKMIFDQVEIQKGWQCVDFGCGGGFFVFELAREVGESGHVLAIDILEEVLEAIESEARLEGVQNVSVLQANLEHEGGSRQQDEFFDLVVVKDILVQNNKKDVLLKEAMRVLKADGKMILIEWDPMGVGLGPAVDVRVAPENIKSLIAEVGLVVEKELEAGVHHYGFLLRKS